jgi:sarcosine oxidase subunit beta
VTDALKSPSVVIIGAGVTGASIAWHLATMGCRDVLVVDRGRDFGEGSTPKATGGFRAQFGTEVNVRLSLLSRAKLERFPDEVGVDSGYRPYGYLFLARTQEELDELRRAQVVQHACGLTEARMIDRAEAMRLNAAVLDEEVIGGAYCPTDGFIRAMQILNGYADAAKRLGVQFQFGTTVTSFDRGVTYVNAAGAWAAEVSNVPVTPLRRRVACTVPATLPEDMPMTIWTREGFHLRVRDGRVMLVWPDFPPNDETWLDRVLRFAYTRIPALRRIEIDPEYCWEGFYEMSPDHHAIIGRDPNVENLYLATGSSGHGVMHAPAIGQLVAEMILGKPATIDIHALRPSRFAEGQPTLGPQLL